MKKSKKTKRTIQSCNQDKNNLDELQPRRINWFPGHMLKAMKKIKERLKMVDIILEIRDARSPLVTGNQSIDNLIGEKNRLIVLNKSDLADPKIIKLWKEWFSKQKESYVFINSFNNNSLKQIVQLSKEIINKKRTTINPDKKKFSKYKMMVIGLPNTGKSTIINKLAKRNATKVADKPGQTRHQLWINVTPELDILDTPGVMPADIENDLHGVWLSVLHAIPNRIVEEEIPACYLVEHLLKIKSSIFKKHYKMETIDIDLLSALNQIAKTRGCIRQKNEYDYERVYKIILADFRNGDLGQISFGYPPKYTEEPPTP